MEPEAYRLNLMRLLETIDPSLRVEFLQTNLEMIRRVISESQVKERVIEELIENAVRNAQPTAQPPAVVE